jgi:hypothetical protein
MLASAQVRQRIQQLLAGATAAGVRVFNGRAWPLDSDELPAIKLASGREDIAPEGFHWPALQEHTLNLEVRGFVRDANDVEAAMDALSAEILEALFGTQAAAELEPLPTCEVQLQGIDRQTNGDGEASTGGVAVRLAITFQTLSNDPHTLV